MQTLFISKKKKLTRKHSSSMGTTHFSASEEGGVCPTALDAEPPDADPLEAEPQSGDRPYPCEQNDRHVLKHYLAPNFVCGR